MRMTFAISDDRGVVEAITAMGEALDDMRPFFRALEPIWWQSRQEMYRTMGRSTRTPWIQYRDTPEGFRYVYVKASMMGRPAAAIQDTVLDWPGSERLRPAMEGTGEGRYRSTADTATVTIDVEYASNHDRGEGTAPDWAWPRIGPIFASYNTPRRRLTSLAGTFNRQFAQLLSKHAGAEGKSKRVGVSTEELARMAAAAMASASGDGA
jgi:hypothetical protein